MDKKQGQICAAVPQQRNSDQSQKSPLVTLPNPLDRPFSIRNLAGGNPANPNARLQARRINLSELPEPAS